MSPGSATPDRRTPRIYLDHAATTPVDPEVTDAMRPFVERIFGNPSSAHSEGAEAREALEGARDSVQRALRATEYDVVFTASGTEADNLAVVGTALAARETGRTGAVVTSAIEHPAVLSVRPLLENVGGGLVEIGVDQDGRVDRDRFVAAVDDTTPVVSLMAANNEVGSIQPVDEIAERVHARGALFHTDAVQYVGKVPIDLDSSAWDLVSISAHKFYGPKGVGALLVRRGTPVQSVVRGGSQQFGLRGGTESVALSVGLARALELAQSECEAETARLERLRSRLRAGILDRFPHARINTPDDGSLANILHVSFSSIDGGAALEGLDVRGVSVSTSSACGTGAQKLSHVLTAMGRPDREIRGALRFSLGRLNDESQLETALEILGEVVGELDALAPS